MDNLPGKNNTTAKILCIILAAVLWLYVMNEQNPPIESSFTVSLETRNLTENLVLIDVPDSVRVKVRGPRSIIAGVRGSDIKAYIDLNTLGEGRHTVKVNTMIPASLELVEVNPDKAVLRLDAAVSRQIPVEIKLIGTAPTGIVVGKASTNLEQITIEGPKSLVSGVDKIIAPVDLTGKNSDFTTEAQLSAVNKEGKQVEGVSLYPDKVTVSLNMVKGLSKKLVEVKPVTYGELPPGITLKSITANPAKVEISGPFDIVDKMDLMYTEPINLAGITQNTSLEVKLQFKDEGLVAKQERITINIGVDVTPAKQ